MRRLLLAAMLLAVSPVAAGCSSTPPTCASPTVTTTVEMQNSTFAPTCISATAGQTLTLHNADTTPHTFTIKGTDVDVKIDASATSEAALSGVAPGTYTVTCLYHPQMTQTLQVT
ncbi:MAG: cupredoxin domain-containing protein [Actinomycetota bacterium]